MNKTLITSIVVAILTTTSTFASSTTIPKRFKQNIIGVVVSSNKESATVESKYGKYQIPKKTEIKDAKYVKFVINNGGTRSNLKDDTVISAANATKAEYDNYNKTEIKYKTIYVANGTYKEDKIIRISGTVSSYVGGIYSIKTKSGNINLTSRNGLGLKNGQAVMIDVENSTKEFEKNRLITLDIQE